MALIRDTKADVVLNASILVFNPQIFDACLEARRHLPRHGDDAVRAASRRTRTPRRGVKLGDYQFERHERLGAGGPAGARRDRDRAGRCRRLRTPRRGRAVLGDRRDRRSATAPTSSSRATTSPRPSRSGRRSRSASTRPVIWEKERGWFTTEPFSEPEMFDFPEGIGPGRVRQRRARRGAARPALGSTASASPSSTGSGDEFIDVLKTLHKLGLDSKEKLTVQGVEVAPARRGRGDAARPDDAR